MKYQIYTKNYKTYLKYAACLLALGYKLPGHKTDIERVKEMGWYNWIILAPATNFFGGYKYKSSNITEVTLDYIINKQFTQITLESGQWAEVNESGVVFEAARNFLSFKDLETINKAIDS